VTATISKATIPTSIPIEKVIDERAKSLAQLSIPKPLSTTATTLDSDTPKSHYKLKHTDDPITTFTGNTATITTTTTTTINKETVEEHVLAPISELLTTTTTTSLTTKQNLTSSSSSNNTSSSGSSVGAWRNQKNKYDKMSTNNNLNRRGTPMTAADIQWNLLKLSGSPIYEVRKSLTTVLEPIMK